MKVNRNFKPSDIYALCSERRILKTRGSGKFAKIAVNLPNSDTSEHRRINTIVRLMTVAQQNKPLVPPILSKIEREQDYKEIPLASITPQKQLDHRKISRFIEEHPGKDINEFIISLFPERKKEWEVFIKTNYSACKDFFNASDEEDRIAQAGFKNFFGFDGLLHTMQCRQIVVTVGDQIGLKVRQKEDPQMLLDNLRHYYDEIAEVSQSQVNFAMAIDKKPILATYGCSPCVALGGYEATNKVAFLAHFSSAHEVRQLGRSIFDNLSTYTKEKIENPIQLHLRGGIKGISEATIKAIKRWMKKRKDLPMQIVSQEILLSGKGLYGKSLLIDSRTGSVSKYVPFG